MSGGAGQTPGKQHNVGLILAVTSKMVFVAPHAIDYALAPSVHALDIDLRTADTLLLHLRRTVGCDDPLRTVGLDVPRPVAYPAAHGIIIKRRLALEHHEH